MTEPTAYAGTADPPEAVALVILPFASEDQALAFANLVRGRNDGRTAIVAAGTCLEFVNGYEADQQGTVAHGGQVIKFFGGKWVYYEDPVQPGVAILMREY